MTSSALQRQVRLLLGESPDALPLSGVLLLVDDFVHECSSSSEPEVLLFQLEDELQAIHHEYVDHKYLWPTEVYLTILYHLCPILPAISIISTWFDLVLRPALREPKLPTAAVNYAKELVISALHKTEDRYPEKIGDFRRRLLDLYLLDAFNEGSGEDVLEWAELDETSREKRTCWKSNLQDVLVRFGRERPHDLMSEIRSCFETPASRLQLLMLLNEFTSQPTFTSSAGAILAKHPLTASLLSSILLDNSSTVCSIGLTIVVKLLPIFAVQACEDLKHMLPQLLAVLARLLCWKERTPLPSGDLVILQDDNPLAAPGLDLEFEFESTPKLHIRPDLNWQRLELTFNATASSAPSPRQFFTYLYYLFPCNVLRFLRGPAFYLDLYQFQSPYVENWCDALDEVQIRSKSESLLRGHILHPLIIWRDADVELAQPNFWTKFDVSRITGEATMLDLRNALLGIRQRHPELVQEASTSTTKSEDDASSSTQSIHPSHLHPELKKSTISLDDMIATSIALKSNVDIDIAKSSSSWPTTLFPIGANSPSKKNVPLPVESSTAIVVQDGQVPTHIAEAISSLQREVLLLRNELNFELWLSRENIKHIGRLYQDSILSKNAEMERQGLYNKLRKYRGQVSNLEKELRDHKEQASSAKNKYADWNMELQKKLKSFREEKNAWITEAASLRSAEKEAQALFSAQGKLLAEANKELLDLQIQKKENQHKIDRLRDYEKQIEQHVKVQALWNEEFVKFNESREHVTSMVSEYKKMEMRLESFEKTQAEMDDAARGYRRNIQALEARLALSQKKSGTARQMPATQIAHFAGEKAAFTKANRKLREDNVELREELEEMRAMLEVLKNQVSGRKGLISEPRSSPLILSPSLGPIM